MKLTKHGVPNTCTNILLRVAVLISGRSWSYDHIQVEDLYYGYPSEHSRCIITNIDMNLFFNQIENDSE